MDNILEYERLVYSIIHKYCGKFDVDDLYQAGMIGLINAYNNFDNGFNTKFSTYAYFYITGEVTKFIRENSNIPISKDIMTIHKKILKTKDLMTQKLGREPTNLEISMFLDLDYDYVEEIESSIISVSSIESDNFDFLNSYGDEDKDMNIDLINLRNEVNKLGEDDKKLIFERYYRDRTQREVSNDLGISQVQVFRKEVKVLEKLKTRIS